MNEIFIKTLYILQGGKASNIMADIKVENVVASTKIVEGLDIKQLAERIPDSKYKPKQPPKVDL